MKKITLFILILLLAQLSFKQEILSHFVDPVSAGGGIACATNPDTIPNNEGEGVFDYIYYWAYTPSDFAFSGDFAVMGVQFPLNFTDTGGSGIADSATAIACTSDVVFHAGNLTEIASQIIEVTAADNGTVIDVIFPIAAEVIADTEIIIAFSNTASNPVPENIDYRIGVNAGDKNLPSYFSSIWYSITAPVTFASIGFPNTHILLNLIGDEVLSTHDNTLADNISIYTNPTNGDLNINFARNFGTTNIDIINVNGEVVLNASINGIGNNTVSTSKLATGIYFAQITAEDGATTTSKIIKN